MKKVLFIVFALMIAAFAAGCAAEHDVASNGGRVAYLYRVGFIAAE